MNALVIRYLLIFLVIALGIIVYSFWKYPNAIKYLLGEGLKFIALIIGAILLCYFLFLNSGPTGNPYEEQDRCETTVAKIC